MKGATQIKGILLKADHFSIFFSTKTAICTIYLYISLLLLKKIISFKKNMMMFEDTCNFTALNDAKIMMIFSHYHEAFKNFPHSLKNFFLLYYFVLFCY